MQISEENNEMSDVPVENLESLLEEDIPKTETKKGKKKADTTDAVPSVVKDDEPEKKPKPKPKAKKLKEKA